MAAKKKNNTNKQGDTVKDANGVTWRYTQGGHWKDDKSGKLFNNGGDGMPSAGNADKAAGTVGNNTYTEALDSITGGKLKGAKESLQSQVGPNGINQAQADAEYARQVDLAKNGSLEQGLSDLANGDEDIAKGFEGGAKIGSALFSPGSLGRVSTEATGEQKDILGRMKSEGEAPSLLQGSFDRAEKTADDAQTLDPRLQKILDLREGALGGLSSKELLATKEMAQSSLNQSLTSAVRALRIGQGGGGPQGAASNIGALPLTAQYANSQADLSRKLILDDYSSKKTALDSFSNDSKDIIGGFEKNRLDANDAAGKAGVALQSDRTQRFNNYVNYSSNLSKDLYGRELQNLNAAAAEKSGAAAAIFGGGGFAAQQKGADQSFELGKENLELQKDIFKSSDSGGGGSSGGSGESTSPGDGDSDVFG